MKKTVLFKPTVLQLLVIFCVSMLLLLPQLFGRGLILGSDAVFHFNRFYETSQQIKEGNYQYFLSIYGFQQSGRIVNALYGPFFAYFQGLLVLISRSCSNTNSYQMDCCTFWQEHQCTRYCEN